MGKCILNTRNKQLCDLILDHNITNIEIGKVAGMSKNTVGHVVRGDRHSKESLKAVVVAVRKILENRQSELDINNF